MDMQHGGLLKAPAGRENRCKTESEGRQCSRAESEGWRMCSLFQDFTTLFAYFCFHLLTNLHQTAEDGG